MTDIFVGDVDMREKISFSTFADAASRTAAAGIDDRYLALGLVGEVGEVVDALKKVYRDISNGMSLKESMIARRPKIEDEIGDTMWYNVMLHSDCIVDADYVFYEGQQDIELAIDTAIKLAVEAANIATYPDRKDFLNITSIICELCQHLGIDLEKVMKKNIDKLKERYPDGFKLGVK